MSFPEISRRKQTLAQRYGAAVLTATTLTLGGVLGLTTEAQAQAAYGSYVGVGGSLGLTSGGPGEDSTAGGVVSFRYRLLEVPVSLRAQALISERVAIVPTVSYDIPLSWDLDAYVGAGVSFPFGGGDDDTSPVGNRTAFVIQPGVDYILPNSDLVLFGNAVIAFDAYRDGDGAAAAVQAGVGLQF
ncbi:hypothetical protein ACQ4M4_10495 [Leptolyngbya sp. AN02str]|uniref:hypothetical protein n=1 Tax=Leptolyngbya sp. AN02str TaxID=3423363 RepID=UPI003D318022